MEISDYGTLIRGITANINQFISSRLKKYGIRQGQYEYFLLIYASPGINQLDLARLKGVGKASVTKALKILESNGFITRKIDNNDKRNYMCHVSEKGNRIIESIKDIKAEAEMDLFNGFSESEKEVLYNCLFRLHGNSKKLAAALNKEK